MFYKVYSGLIVMVGFLARRAREEHVASSANEFASMIDTINANTKGAMGLL